MTGTSGHRRGFAPLLAAALAMLFFAWGPARADQPAGTGRVPLPVLPKATGKHCVKPTEWMRHNHMKLLFRERDLTVYKGEFIKGRSIEDCIACHVHREPDGQWPKPTSKKFFCETCHAYAAVKIDCFECHAAHPVKAPPGVGPNGGNPLPADAKPVPVGDLGAGAHELTPMPVSQGAGGGSK
ncbi:hypothetical protein BMS3Bbin12_02292 [bacterium BMS3Bbin12]|nr:hypothetical protein BMS3Abin12_00995 [bacterium BMS3Abin12]GBE49099.1 hypothetical protein BMS3Bbin12_02292 [bacterium BMS3Bbin12]GBE50842.1 hypothetical protein BMS3Bbin13_01792 [bacterium BMS3Bbin13]HDK02614.1 hypothetical protein [Gammaproteobacteria bacterium]